MVWPECTPQEEPRGPDGCMIIVRDICRILSLITVSSLRLAPGDWPRRKARGGKSEKQARVKGLGRNTRGPENMTVEGGRRGRGRRPRSKDQEHRTTSG